MECEVRIRVDAPCECTDEQFKEWVEYSVGYRGGISIDNPLHQYDLEASDVDLL